MAEIDVFFDKASAVFPVKQAAEIDSVFPFHPVHKRMLQRSNGMYAFDGGLHFFGVGGPAWHDIEQWNDTGLWKGEYGDSFKAGYCFSETSFGDQFYYDDAGRIGRMEAETGYKEIIADDFARWALMVGEAIEEFTDVDIMKDWVASSGMKMRPGLHLCPSIPFCLGGVIERGDDGYLCEAIANMRFKGQLAIQISKLAPGDKVDLQVVNLPDRFEGGGGKN